MGEKNRPGVNRFLHATRAVSWTDPGRTSSGDTIRNSLRQLRSSGTPYAFARLEQPSGASGSGWIASRNLSPGRSVSPATADAPATGDSGTLSHALAPLVSPTCFRSATGSSPGYAWAWSCRGRAAQWLAVYRAPRHGAEPRGLRRPGPVDSLASRGCHRLIRDGAKLVETVDDILEELGPLVREVHTAPDETPVRHPAELVLSDQERACSASSTTIPWASTH